MVKCSDCGFLTIWMRLQRRFEEAPMDYMAPQKAYITTQRFFSLNASSAEMML